MRTDFPPVRLVPETFLEPDVVASLSNRRGNMETYEIRVLTKRQTGGGIYSSSHQSDQAAVLRALALASPGEAVIEVWCGSRCIYAGALGEVRISA